MNMMNNLKYWLLFLIHLVLVVFLQASLFWVTHDADGLTDHKRLVIDVFVLLLLDIIVPRLIVRHEFVRKTRFFLFNLCDLVLVLPLSVIAIGIICSGNYSSLIMFCALLLVQVILVVQRILFCLSVCKRRDYPYIAEL